MARSVVGPWDRGGNPYGNDPNVIAGQPAGPNGIGPAPSGGQVDPGLTATRNPDGTTTWSFVDPKTGNTINLPQSAGYSEAEALSTMLDYQKSYAGGEGQTLSQNPTSRRGGTDSHGRGSGGGGTGTTGTGTADPAAVALLQGVLAQYGLESMLPWAKSELVNGATPDQVALDLRNQPEFDARFPAIKLRQTAGLPPLSPAEYVAYEKTASQLMQQYIGIPGFYTDKSHITSLLVNDISPTELQDRLNQGYSAVANAPQSIQDAYARYYGVRGANALAANFLDPTIAEPALIRQAQIAGIGGEATQYGQDMSFGIASKINNAGVSAYQRHADFMQANAWRPLQDQTVGEASGGQNAVSSDTLQSAAFGLDAMSQLAIANLLQQRKAAVTDTGAQAALTSAGATGLGVAQSVA